MRRLGIAALLCAVLGSGAGCGGPQYLSNTFSDWYAKKYSESPWIWGNTISYMVYGFVYGFAWFGDSVIVNPVHFWVKDAQPIGDGKGSTFSHKASPGKKAN